MPISAVLEDLHALKSGAAGAPSPPTAHIIKLPSLNRGTTPSAGNAKHIAHVATSTRHHRRRGGVHGSASIKLGTVA